MYMGFFCIHQTRRQREVIIVCEIRKTSNSQTLFQFFSQTPRRQGMFSQTPTHQSDQTVWRQSGRHARRHHSTNLADSWTVNAYMVPGSNFSWTRSDPFFYKKKLATLLAGLLRVGEELGVHIWWPYTSELNVYEKKVFSRSDISPRFWSIFEQNPWAK